MTQYTLVGIDPSFSRTGMALVTPGKEVLFQHFSRKIGHKSFDNIYEVSDDITNEMIEFLEPYKPYRVIMESPLPNSLFSAGLYCLDTMLMYKLNQNGVVIKTYNPITLTHIHGKRGSTKKESVALADLALQEMVLQGYTIPKKSPNHDVAEAILYIHYYCFTEPREKNEETPLCSPFVFAVNPSVSGE